MGTLARALEVFSPDRSRSETIEARVDTGSTFTCLPSSVLAGLGIIPTRNMKFELADGNVIEDDIGEAQVSLEGIETTTIVVFADDSAPALLGTYTLEGSLLVVDPVTLRLVPTTALRHSRHSTVPR